MFHTSEIMSSRHWNLRIWEKFSKQNSEGCSKRNVGVEGQPILPEAFWWPNNAVDRGCAADFRSTQACVWLTQCEGLTCTHIVKEHTLTANISTWDSQVSSGPEVQAVHPTDPSGIDLWLFFNESRWLQNCHFLKISQINLTLWWFVKCTLHVVTSYSLRVVTRESLGYGCRFGLMDVKCFTSKRSLHEEIRRMNNGWAPVWGSSARLWQISDISDTVWRIPVRQIPWIKQITG